MPFSFFLLSPQTMQITDIFRAKIVDVQPSSLTIEITGSEAKVSKFLGLMENFGVQELLQEWLTMFFLLGAETCFNQVNQVRHKRE